MHKLTAPPGGGVSRAWALAAPPWRDDLRTLLIVDDEEGPRQSLRLIFEEFYNVLLAASGHEALELARQRPVDAAVIDLRMAGMSGIELLRRLKGLDAKLEVTILTAYAALETARQAIRLGASDYLTKPFDLDSIRGAVARMMERRALNQRTESNLKRLQELEEEAQALRDRGELLQDRGEVYADVLHDINKPITVIVGMLSVLDRRFGEIERVEGGDLADLRHRLKSLNRQAENVVSVIQRYLGFFRQDRRAGQTVGVNQVLLDLRALLRVYPRAQSREIDFGFLPSDAQVKANATDLLQILLNLAANALDATAESGRVEIAAGVPDSDLALPGGAQRFVSAPDFDTRGPKIAITVRDYGPGIPAGVTDKIFDASVTTKPHGLGTGLGLTIVKKLVVLSRGALALQTAPGAGTTVTVFLPAAERHEVEPLHALHDAGPKHGKPH